MGTIVMTISHRSESEACFGGAVNVANRMLGGAVTFVTVVEAGSFRRAARALEITPSGVSRAIARLEEQLGVRLFHRHPRAVALTDEGQRFHDEIRPLVDGINHAAETAQDSAGHVTGRLKIQCCPPFAHYVLVPNVHTFLEHHSALSVDIEIRDQLGDLVGESFDLAVRFGNPEPSSLVVRKLTETEVLTCAAPSYIEKHGLPNTPLDLANGQHRCIQFRFPHSGKIADWDFLIDGSWQSLPVKGRMIVNDAPSVLAACLSGHGIAQPLDLYSRDALRSKRLIRVLPAWNQERYPLYAYLPSRRHPPAKVRMILSFIEKLVGLAGSDPSHTCPAGIAQRRCP
ncbi:MAG: LysR family transcriptional regulator [Steroidobacteraceae bacterium]|jgi:DNA-binding transcriptional LysR family regulator